MTSSEAESVIVSFHPYRDALEQRCEEAVEGEHGISCCANSLGEPDPSPKSRERVYPPVEPLPSAVAEEYFQ